MLHSQLMIDFWLKKLPLTHYLNKLHLTLIFNLILTCIFLVFRYPSAFVTWGLQASNPESLLKQRCTLSICMSHHPGTIGIIIEGQPVVGGVPNLSKACCLLFGLTYALDLKYPSKLYTFICCFVVTVKSDIG